MGVKRTNAKFIPCVLLHENHRRHVFHMDWKRHKSYVIVKQSLLLYLRMNEKPVQFCWKSLRSTIVKRNTLKYYQLYLD